MSVTPDARTRQTGRGGPDEDNDVAKANDPKVQDAPPAKVVTVAGISPRTLARIATERLGRPVNDKRVRSVARDTLARFQDEAYTAHAYTPAEAAGLLTALSSKGRGAASMSDDDATAAIDALADKGGAA